MAEDDGSRAGNIRIERAGPPPGSVSALQLSDDAAEAVRDFAPSMLPIPLLPRIPWWAVVGGVAAVGAAAYATWKIVEKTAPVLVPMALGVPPGTALALQGILSNNPRAAVEPAPATVPMSALPAMSTAAPAASAASTQVVGAGISEADLASIMALAPALGPRGSATATALAAIAANIGPISEAAKAVSRSVVSARGGGAGKTMVSAR